MTTDLKHKTKDELRSIIGEKDYPMIFKILAAGAADHVARSPLFEAAEYNPKEETHNFSRVSFEPVESTLEEVLGLLNFARPDWRTTILPAYEAQPDLIKDLAERLQRPQAKITLVLAHDMIEDIAYHFVVVIYLLTQYIPFDDLKPKLHIVLGNVVRTINAFGRPAAETLRKICWVHFSFPRTASAGKLSLPPTFVDASNTLLNLELAEFEVMFAAVATPGSLDLRFHIPKYKIPRKLHRFLDGPRGKRYRTIHVQPAGYGTYLMVQGEVFAVASMLSEKPFFVEVGRLVEIKTHNDLHRLMEWVAERRTLGTGIPTIYHRTMTGIERIWRYLDNLKRKRSPE